MRSSGCLSGGRGSFAQLLYHCLIKEISVCGWSATKCLGLADGEEKETGFLFLPKQPFHPVRRLHHVRRGQRSFSALTATGGSEGRKATFMGNLRIAERTNVGKNDYVLESLPKSASNCLCYQLRNSLALRTTLGALEIKQPWDFAPRLQRAAVPGCEPCWITGVVQVSGDFWSSQDESSNRCSAAPFLSSPDSQAVSTPVFFGVWIFFFFNTIFSTLGRLGRLNSPSELKP